MSLYHSERKRTCAGSLICSNCRPRGLLYISQHRLLSTKPRRSTAGVRAPHLHVQCITGGQSVGVGYSMYRASVRGKKMPHNTCTENQLGVGRITTIHAAGVGLREGKRSVYVQGGETKKFESSQKTFQILEIYIVKEPPVRHNTSVLRKRKNRSDFF